MNLASGGMQTAVLLVFFLCLAFGFSIGEEVAESESVGEDELEDAMSSPVETVPADEYETFHNETEENLTVATIEQYGALITMPEGEGVGGDSSTNIIRNGVRTMLFPAYLSAPWGYQYPGKAEALAHLSILAWIGQLGYIVRRQFGGGRA